MSAFKHRTAAELQRLQALADQVVDILGEAGLPVINDPSVKGRGGPIVEVDTGADSAGGVYVSWLLSERHMAMAADLMLRGDLSNPLFERGGRIKSAMCGAIIEILHSAGLSAYVAEDDLRPLQVQVHK